MAENIYLPEFRVSYPHMFEPKLNELSGKMEYSLVALFPLGADLSKAKLACKQIMIDKFGPDPKKWPDNLKSPFRDQNDKRKKDKDGNYYLPEPLVAGALFCNLRTINRPGLVDKAVKPIIDPMEFYAGCWAIATVCPYYFDKMGNTGIALGLRNVQKTRDDGPLSSRMKAEDEFQPIEGAAADPMFDDPKPTSATSMF